MKFTTKRVKVRYGLERVITSNGHGWFTIEGPARHTRGAEGMFDAEGGVVDENALWVGFDYGFGKITSIHSEPSGKEDYFKIRVEVEP
jgi:hypothetical protein